MAVESVQTDRVDRLNAKDLKEEALKVNRAIVEDAIVK